MTVRLSYLTLGNTFWENNSKERKYLHRDICGHLYITVINWKLLGCGGQARRLWSIKTMSYCLHIWQLWELFWKIWCYVMQSQQKKKKERERERENLEWWSHNDSNKVKVFLNSYRVEIGSTFVNSDLGDWVLVLSCCYSYIHIPTSVIIDQDRKSVV